MIISVIGLGYIGLPTAALIASRGVKVIGVDSNSNTVDTINQGKIHISEPELGVLVAEAVEKNQLKAVIKPEKADVFLIAVPTPLLNDYKPDLSYIKSAAKAIAPFLEKGNLVILESTAPVGSTEKMLELMKEERSDLSFPEFNNTDSEYDIAIAYCPERVLPGYVLNELIVNDRIIGGVTLRCAEQAIEVYKIFVESQCFITDCRTAELTKLVENSFRDLNIAFANELSLICDKLDINVWEMIKFANHHPRVNILQPGPGVGGHCIAVDPWFLVDSAKNESKLIRTARLVNDSKPNFVLDKIDQAVNSLGGKKFDISIACLGLAFKPDIGDLRESPAINIAKQLCLMSFKEVFLVEPNIIKLPKGFKAGTKLTVLEEALEEAEIIVLLVDHRQFKTMDLNLLSGKQVIDTRGIWS